MRLKRAMDILVGSLLAAGAIPMICVLGLGCAISLRAWPLFVQWRVGKDGREFRFLKLRTLPPRTPPAVDKYALNGTPIPSFCRFLRRTHLDELPQLLLVPVGRMSLVGPRPEMPTVLSRYPVEFADARSRVRPGCTGLWQLSASSTKLIYEAPEYDLAYLRGAGVRLDLWILYRTLRSLFLRRRAIVLDDLPRWTLSSRSLRVPKRVPEPVFEFEVDRAAEPRSPMPEPEPPPKPTEPVAG